MLRVLGHGSTLCDGQTRREILQAGALSLFGLTLPDVWKAAAASPSKRPAKAKSVIFFNLLGGPAHQDMFDLKPDAPADVRGEFRPISTVVPGLQICEHLPRTAKWLDRACLIRSMSHGHNAHNPLPIMTGFTEGNPSAVFPDPNDPPDIGAICQYVGLGAPDVPGAVCLPCYPGWGQTIRRPGPYGGFLGSQYDPLCSLCDPTFAREPKTIYYDPVMPQGEPFLPGLTQQLDLTVDRLGGRKSLLTQLDEQFRLTAQSKAQERLDHYQRRAFELLTSSKTREAFDLSREPDSIRDRYGRNLFGSSILVARRLVEAGVPFISVHQEIFKHYGHAYDMHSNNFGMLKDLNLPLLDQVYPALIQDLEERGLLDSTLVVVMGEMGRTPRINKNAGRDHWPQCGFSLLTGGGIQPGAVYGASDKQAAWPARDPVHPSQLVATIYHLLGIDPHLIVHDRSGRPHAIARGADPIEAILA